VKESFRAGLMGGVLLSVLVPIWAATAQSQQQVDRCANNDQNVTLDQRIDACTAAIASGKWSGPGLAWAYNNRSFAYILQGDYDRGIADADEAIRLDPNDAVAFNNRGNGYREKELYDRAIADYTEAIRIDPSYALAFKNRGSVYQQQGDLDRAIADYSKAVQLEPTFAIAFADREPAPTRKKVISTTPSSISAL
jgi:tetratricopeptide (TPR) repeat protein